MSIRVQDFQGALGDKWHVCSVTSSILTEMHVWTRDTTFKEVQTTAGLPPRPNQALPCLDQVTFTQKRKKLKTRSEEKPSGRNLHLKENGISDIPDERLRWTGNASTYLK